MPTTPPPAPRSLFRRALLAVLFLLGYYVLALCVAAALLYAAYRLLVTREGNPLLILFLGVVSVALLLSLVPKPDDFEPPGPLLRPEDHPRLFAMLQELAQAAGQRMPDEVYLLPSANAWVASRGGIMGLGGRRVMGLGLPLLQLLDVDQLRGVLAHELGHYHGGDVMLSPWIYHTRASIGRTVEAVRGSILQLPFELYGSTFVRITSEISRHQELQADALAARLVGPQPLIEALKTTTSASLAHAAFLRFDVIPVLRAGYRPPIIEGFRRFSSVEEQARALREAVAEELDHEATHVFDTHPALSDRIEALAALSLEPRIPSAAPGRAIDLLDAPEQLEGELLEHVLPTKDGEREPITWEEVGARVQPEIVRQQAGACAEHVEGLTLATIPTDRDGLARWAERAMLGTLGWPELTLQTRASLAAEAIGAVILHRLVETGWHLVVSPGRPIAAARDDRRFEVMALLERLALGSASAWTWRLECEGHGVLDLPLRGPVPGEAERPASGPRGEPELPSTWMPVAWEREPGSMSATVSAGFAVTYAEASGEEEARPPVDE